MFGGALGHAGISIVSDINKPAPIRQHRRNATPSEYELDHMNRSLQEESPSGAATPRTPNEIEMSRPSSPAFDGAAEVVQSWKE
jgi:hypothetical protein